MITVGLHGGGRMTVGADGAVDVSAVTPQVLAFGLSHVTRFGGQSGCYSVAEHSVRMYNWAKKERQDKAVLRAILLHDAPECLGEGDTQRFVKLQYGVGGVKAFTHSVALALWEKHRPVDRDSTVWCWDCMHEQVKYYDTWMGAVEARAFGFPHEPIPEWVVEPVGPSEPWEAHLAKLRFLAAWEESA